jgi:hAT family C-terminal dimerisation region
MTFRYFNAPLAAEGTDVLAFWKSNQFNYPILARMARDYLSLQASSVPAERAFSSGVDLITPNRCSLGGKTVEMTQFLKFNLK